MTTPEGAGLLGFHLSPDGDLYVNVADLVVWTLGYAVGLKERGDAAGADAVASVGNMLADQLGPDPEGP